MKFLVICEGGFTRSVCMAGHLRNNHGAPHHDAIALAGRFNSYELTEKLSAWAEKIVVMEPKHRDYVPTEYHHKIEVCDVGPDRYGNSLHPDLVKQIEDWCRARGYRE